MAAPDDAGGSGRGRRRVLVEGQDRPNREGAVVHGLLTDGDGHGGVATSVGLVDGPRSLPPRVGVHGGTAGQGVVDAHLEGGAGRHLGGLGPGEELGDVQSTESGLHLNVDGEGLGVVHRVGVLQTAPHHRGLVRVLHTGLNNAVGRGRGGGVVDVVVGLRCEGAGHGDGGGVALDGDVEVEVALADVLIGTAGVGDLAIEVVPPLGGADAQLPVALSRDVDLPGAELVGEGDGRAGPAVHGQRLAVLLKRLLDLVRPEGHFPVHLLGGAGDIGRPLAHPLRLVLKSDILSNLAAGHRHLGLLAVGIDCHIGRVAGLRSQHQSRSIALQAGEALADDGVESAVEGAGDGAVVHHALTDGVLSALVGDLHRLGEALPVAELLGQLDLKGVAASGAGVASIPGELQLEDVIDLDRSVIRFLDTVGVGDHKRQAGDGDRRIVGGSGLRGQDRQERGDERDQCDKSTYRAPRSAKHPGDRDGGHGRPFERILRRGLQLPEFRFLEGEGQWRRSHLQSQLCGHRISTC